MSGKEEQQPETSDGRSSRARKEVNYKLLHEGKGTVFSLKETPSYSGYESSHDVGDRVLYDDPSDEVEQMKKEMRALDEEKALLQKSEEARRMKRRSEVKRYESER